jgi:hypothetical protein
MVARTVHAGPQPVEQPFAPAQAGPAQIRPAQASEQDPDLAVAAATAVPRRPVGDTADRARSDIPWLGIGSWVLLCAALFASLIGWPDQTAIDRVSWVWSNDSVSTAVDRAEPTPTHTPAAPSREQDWSAMTPGTAADLQGLPPTEMAPPIRPSEATETIQRAPGGPPLPQFKPNVDRVAAKFSNAFFEIGERLQQEGDFDAALHMRRQGSNLDPWKASGSSDL